MRRRSLWVWAAGLAAGVGYAMLPGRVAERIGQAGAREHALGFAALSGMHCHTHTIATKWSY